MENEIPRLVILESPFAGKDDNERIKHLFYLRECIRDSMLIRGEAPFASHMMYPGPLRDDVPEERELGMAAGLAWATRAERAVFYIDFGMSPGMREAQEHHQWNGLPCEYRKLHANIIQEILDEIWKDFTPTSTGIR